MPTPARLAFAALPVALLAALPSAASAQADISAVWSFNGGQVVVQAGAGGLQGTIIRATRFADCEHPVGEVMWTGLVAQADGSYWGGHQWFRPSTCEAIPTRGNTAFRVLTGADGARRLRVCFAAPERPELQPTIAADGSSINTTAGCQDSDFVAPVGEKPKFREVVKLPAARRCVSRRNFRIRLREPKGDALRSAVVFVNGKRVKAVRGERLTARVDLRGLPKGRYKVKIVAKTVLGRTMRGTRRYRTCTPGDKGARRP
jgi:hypothetical protein